MAKVLMEGRRISLFCLFYMNIYNESGEGSKREERKQGNDKEKEKER